MVMTILNISHAGRYRILSSYSVVHSISFTKRDAAEAATRAGVASRLVLEFDRLDGRLCKTYQISYWARSYPRIAEVVRG